MYVKNQLFHTFKANEQNIAKQVANYEEFLEGFENVDVKKTAAPLKNQPFFVFRAGMHNVRIANNIQLVKRIFAALDQSRN